MTLMDSIMPNCQPRRLIMDIICTIMLAMQKTERVLTMKFRVVRRMMMNAKVIEMHTPWNPSLMR